LANQLNPWLSFAVLRPCRAAYALQLIIRIITIIIK